MLDDLCLWVWAHRCTIYMAWGCYMHASGIKISLIGRRLNWDGLFHCCRLLSMASIQCCSHTSWMLMAAHSQLETHRELSRPSLCLTLLQLLRVSSTQVWQAMPPQLELPLPQLEVKVLSGLPCLHSFHDQFGVYQETHEPHQDDPVNAREACFTMCDTWNWLANLPSPRLLCLLFRFVQTKQSLLNKGNNLEAFLCFYFGKRSNFMHLKYSSINIFLLSLVSAVAWLSCYAWGWQVASAPIGHRDSYLTMFKTGNETTFTSFQFWISFISWVASFDCDHNACLIWLGPRLSLETISPEEGYS